MLEISGQTAGKYLILECVGHGGMSAIYKAVDLTDDRTVALKVLSAAVASDPDFEARFSREIEVLRTLKHPHILPILDYGKLNGSAYIVMPFYQHGTLKDRINKGITLKQGSKIIRQVSEALEYAHAQGITHRDVKPTNILLDEKGNAVLSDFGFAHLSDASLNLTGSALIGTPAYMSPEQCRGEEVGGNSDQYSLAVVIYQMATGRPPFEADTPMGLVFKHLHDPIPNPRDVNRKVPEDVEDVLLKALDKDPSRRYPSVAALNQAFQGAVSQSLSALPAGALNRLRLRTRIKRFRRRIDQTIHRLSRSPKFMQRFRVGLVISVLFAIPLAVWAMFTFGEGMGGANAPPEMLYITQDPTDIVAEAIAGAQTQIAGTIEALPLGSDGTATATPIPSAMPTNTPRPFWPPPTRTPTVEPSATATETPTETPTATPTATPTPTPTPIPSVHVSDLDVVVTGDEERWEVEVIIYVDDHDGQKKNGATVTGTWTVSGSGVTLTCETWGPGNCSIYSGEIEEEAETTFTVSDVSYLYYDYAPEDNWDPDGDSDGTSITADAPSK
jgi:serine/threonine-protein kinase